MANDLLTQFTKKELITLSRELGLNWSSDDQKLDIIDKMVHIGIYLAHSDTDIELSLEAIQFLVTAGVIDEDGIPRKEMEELPEKLPPCFGYADNDDPSCQRCVVFIACHAKRLTQRPPCFGLEYQATAPECVLCFEARFCKLSIEKEKE